MNIIFSSMEEAINKLYNILNQGDSRYNDPESEVWLAGFLLKKAVSLEEREIPSNIYVEEEVKFEVQEEQKKIAKELLKLEDFKDNEILIEVAFRGFRPDIMAEKPHRRIIVECCSCKIKKVIDFLRESDEVWILTKGYAPWKEIAKKSEDSKMQWFIFSKSEKWSQSISFYDKFIKNMIVNVKNPLDNL